MSAPSNPKELKNVYAKLSSDYEMGIYAMQEVQISSSPAYSKFNANMDQHMDLNINAGHSEDNSEGDKGDSLYRSIWGFLLFGKVIGLLPFSGLFQNSWKNVHFKRKSISSLITHGIAIILIFNSSIYLVHTFRSPKKNALDIANAIRPTMYTAWGCLLYIYFLWRGSRFLNIFNAWSSAALGFYKPDVTLRRDTILIGGTILVSAILENTVLHLEYFKYFDRFNGKKNKDLDANKSFLETYYWRAHWQWASLFGYNWFLAVLGFIQHKWTLYSVNYMDAMLAVFGRALYFRFKSLCEEAEVHLLRTKDGESEGKILFNDQRAWIRAVQDHQSLYNLVAAVEDFFTPIVFGSYTINLFYVSLQLFDGLTNDVVSHSIVHGIYTPWSFIHLVMRAFLVSICCARINMYGHQIRDILHNCPIEIYSTEISRVNQRVTAGPDIGLTGLGCFTITKSFMLSILMVVFTFEIVLLQCDPGNDDPTKKKC